MSEATNELTVPFESLTESQQKIVLRSNQAKLNDEVDKLRKAIFGNGEVGLTEIVRDHSEFIRELRDWKKVFVTAVIIETIGIGFLVVSKILGL